MQYDISFLYCYSLFQIEHWKATRQCKFIDENLLKIYLLMAGEMQAEINGRAIFVNDGLDGLQVSKPVFKLLIILLPIPPIIFTYFRCKNNRFQCLKFG